MTATVFDDNAFEWLIAPLGVTDFDRDHYEQNLCHVRRSTTDYYTRLLTWQDLDVALCTHAMTPSEISLVKNGTPVPKSSYVDDEDRVSPVAVAQQFNNGSTIIFNHLHRHVPALARLCSSIGKSFSSRVQANIYLTPAGSEGFAPHWDTHDVFVLQVTGRKTWRVHDTKIPLPLQGQGFDSRRDEAGEVTSTFELEAGSFVYLPRGLIHSAKAGEEASLHITLGVTAVTWTEFLLECVAATALKNKELRRNLPRGFMEDRSNFRDEYRQKLQGLLEILDGEAAIDYFTSRIERATLEPPCGVLKENRAD